MANLGQLLTKKIKKNLKIKCDSLNTGRTLKAQKTPTTSYAHSTYPHA